VRQLIRSAGAKRLFLPKHSPDLNPIEQSSALVRSADKLRSLTSRWGKRQRLKSDLIFWLLSCAASREGERIPFYRNEASARLFPKPLGRHRNSALVPT
jgi:transposase